MHARKPISIFLLLATSVFCGCYIQSISIREYSSFPWELVWADEFNYVGLPDPQKWTFDVGGAGWGNRELQYYTSGARKMHVLKMAC